MRPQVEMRNVTGNWKKDPEFLLQEKPRERLEALHQDGKKLIPAGIKHCKKFLKVSFSQKLDIYYSHSSHDSFMDF